jgi:hypothetical protein
MRAVLLIGALLLGGRVYLRYRRQHSARQNRREDTHRWEDDGGALRTSAEPPGL